MSNSGPKKLTRKSAKRLCSNDKFSMTLEVVDAIVLENEIGDENCLIRATGFKLRNSYFTTTGDERQYQLAEVYLTGDAENPELVINAGLAQRFVSTGLSENDRKKLSAAPTSQIADLVADRDENQRSEVAEQLLKTLSASERARLLKSILGNDSEVIK